MDNSPPTTAAAADGAVSTEGALEDTLMYSVERIVGDVLCPAWWGACASYGVEAMFGTSLASDLGCAECGVLGRDGAYGTTPSPMRSSAVVAHSTVFPPLRNVVSERDVFPRGNASEFVSEMFGDGAPMSMERFHAERGDADPWFEVWQPVPPHSSSQLEKSGGGGAGQCQSPSLIDDAVSESLLSAPTLERRGSFRTAVRLPAVLGGASVKEISVVQRILHVGGSDRDDSGEVVAYVVESDLRLLHVPYGDRFRVVMRKTVGTESVHVADDNENTDINSDDNSLCSCPAGNIWSPRPREATREAQHHAATSTTLRIEFEIRFERSCKYEDRIRKMLTKKVTKLLKSWCRWAHNGWERDRLPTIDRDNPRQEEGGGDDIYEDGFGWSACGASLLPPNKWAPLWHRQGGGGGSRDNAAMLLWSMTELCSDADDGTEDETLSSNEGSFLLMEWRDDSLNEMRPDDNEYRTQDESGHQGIGVELCLSEDEGRSAFEPRIAPQRQSCGFHNRGTEVANSQQKASSCGVEVVYVAENKTSEEDEDASLLNQEELTEWLKRQSQSNFRRRRNTFRRHKKMKLLD